MVSGWVRGGVARSMAEWVGQGGVACSGWVEGVWPTAWLNGRVEGVWLAVWPPSWTKDPIWPLHVAVAMATVMSDGCRLIWGQSSVSSVAVSVAMRALNKAHCGTL